MGHEVSGSSWIWTEWETHFKAFGFVPILDFIHALTRVYAAALAAASKAARNTGPIPVPKTSCN